MTWGFPVDMRVPRLHGVFNLPLASGILFCVRMCSHVEVVTGSNVGFCPVLIVTRCRAPGRNERQYVTHCLGF